MAGDIDAKIAELDKVIRQAAEDADELYKKRIHALEAERDEAQAEVKRLREENAELEEAIDEWRDGKRRGPPPSGPHKTWCDWPSGPCDCGLHSGH